MTDLTKITTPFGLLDEETQEALRSHSINGGDTQCYGAYGWRTTSNPSWSAYHTYRTKVIPFTKPSINWDHVSPLYNYLWVDQNGITLLSRTEPRCASEYWACGPVFVSPKSFSSFTPGTCDWKDSLVCRHE